MYNGNNDAQRLINRIYDMNSTPYKFVVRIIYVFFKTILYFAILIAINYGLRTGKTDFILILLAAAFPAIDYAAKHILQHIGQRKQLYEKLPNPDLRQFQRMRRWYILPWNMCFSGFVFCYMFSMHRYITMFCIGYWMIFQVIDYFSWEPLREMLYYRMLKKSILQKKKEDESFPWKQFIHGILMRDDTNKIAVTFSRGYDRPGTVPIFDYKTEIEPWENGETNFDWTDVYLMAAFMVYIFDASLYSQDELEKACTDAFTGYHYQISRVTFLYIIGDKEKYDYILKKYEWLHEVRIYFAEDAGRIHLQEIANIYLNQFSFIEKGFLSMISYYQKEDIGLLTYLLDLLSEKIRSKRIPVSAGIEKSMHVLGAFNQFYCINPYNDWWRNEFLNTVGRSIEECTEIYRNYNNCVAIIYYRIPYQEDYYPFHTSNIYICGFFQNIFRPEERKVAILAGFDYADMVLRFVLYYLVQKRGLGFHREYVYNDLQSMGDRIVELLCEGDPVFETVVCKPVECNESLRNVFWILDQLLNLELSGEELYFQDLVHLLRILRNRTRGHGAIMDEIAEPLWYVMYVLLVILGNMLQIYKFKVREDEDEVCLGYYGEDNIYYARKYAVLHGHMPCPIYRVGKKKEYINYFSGDFIVPDLIEVD